MERRIEVKDIFMWLVDFIFLGVVVLLNYKILWLTNFATAQLVITVISLVFLIIILFIHRNVEKSISKDKNLGIKNPYAVSVGLFISVLVFILLSVVINFNHQTYLVVDKKTNIVVRTHDPLVDTLEYLIFDFNSKYIVAMEGRKCVYVDQKTKGLNLNFSKVCYSLMRNSVIGLSKERVDELNEENKDIFRNLENNIIITSINEEIVIKFPTKVGQVYEFADLYSRP